MVKNMLFVYNPLAGKAQIRTKLVDILQVFSEAGYEITIYPTRFAGDAAEIVKNKKNKFDIVACCGGDGTLDEVVNGMMECRKKVPIGYVPAGSTNDFAISLDLSKNMVKAAQTVVNGKAFSCDIGSFNHNTFVYIAAFGLFTDVSYETPQGVKNILGHMAYILEGMKRLPAIQSIHMKLTCKNMEIEDDFLYGMITNSTSVGGFKKITGKYVELNDGLFEVTLIRCPRNPLELNQIMTALMGGNVDTDCMYCFKTDEITFTSEETVAWTLDGEYGGEHTEVVINNLPGAIEIMIPEKVKKME